MSTSSVDEELVPVVAALSVVDRTDVPGARKVLADRTAASGRWSSIDEGVTTEDRSFQAPDGHRVGVRVYLPERRTSDGAVYHVHGGGFIVGDLEMDHMENVALARTLGAAVVAVDYRLAPEWPYPTPLDDVYAGLGWLHAESATLGINPDRLVVRGQSAGGGLALASALMTRDRGGPPISFQLLTSPAIDDRGESRSFRRFTDTPALTRRDMELCWSAYLGSLERGGSKVPAYAAPARATNLAGLPSTYISVAELDPLRDEALALAQSLLAAEVAVELHLFPGTFHGSVTAAVAAVSRRQRTEETAILHRVLHRPTTASRTGDGT